MAMIDPDTSRRWQWLAIIAMLAFVIWVLAPVLMPFAIAAMFAYLGDPLANRLQHWGLGRTLAVTVVFTIMLLIVAGVLLLLLPLLQHQIDNFIGNVPYYLDWLRHTALPWLRKHLHLNAKTFNSAAITAAIKGHIGSVGSVLAATLSRVSRSGMGVVSWMTNLVLVPVVTFYLLRDWHVMVEHIHRIIPRSVEPTAVKLARDSDHVLGAFVRGQLLVMLALGVIYGVGLTVIGISVGPLIGMLAGLLSFVPYLGFLVGLIASLIAALAQYGDWLHIALVLVVFAIGQVMEGYVLVPRLVGGKIGLHPVAVIFAVLAGGHLFGFLGVLLALPAAAVIMVLLRYGYARYRDSRLYTYGGGAKDNSMAASLVAGVDRDTTDNDAPEPED